MSFRFSRCLLLALAGLALLMLLSGCWVPERYIGRIKVERNGSYTANVEGTAVHPESYRAVHRLEGEVQQGKPKEEELKKRRAAALSLLEKDLEDSKKNAEITYVNSLGDGRVRFTVSGSWSIDRDAVLFSKLLVPLAYSIGSDGSVRLRVKDALPNREARSLGITTEGDISLVLAEGIEVLEHNAQVKPTSARGAYRWRIDNGTTEPPFIKIRFPAQPQGAQPHKELNPGAHK